MAVPLDFAEEPPAALPHHSGVVCAPVEAAGRWPGGERCPFGCSPGAEAFGADPGFLAVGAEPGAALWWGRAVPACRWSLGRVKLARGKGLGCEGPPIPANQLQVMATQVWRVWDQPVLDVNFWDLISSALKL